MPKRRGAYLGGSTIIRASVALARERTKKTQAKTQRERERFEAEQLAFEDDRHATLIKANSPEGRERLLKHLADQERRAKREAKRRAKRATNNLGV